LYSPLKEHTTTAHLDSAQHGYLHGEQASIPVVARAEVREDQLLGVDLRGKAGRHLRRAVAVYPSVVLHLAATHTPECIVRGTHGVRDSGVLETRRFARYTLHPTKT
jgi:hypothetical protein